MHYIDYFIAVIHLLLNNTPITVHFSSWNDIGIVDWYSTLPLIWALLYVCINIMQISNRYILKILYDVEM